MDRLVRMRPRMLKHRIQFIECSYMYKTVDIKTIIYTTFAVVYLTYKYIARAY